MSTRGRYWKLTQRRHQQRREEKPRIFDRLLKPTYQTFVRDFDRLDWTMGFAIACLPSHQDCVGYEPPSPT